MSKVNKNDRSSLEFKEKMVSNSERRKEFSKIQNSFEAFADFEVFCKRQICAILSDQK